MNYKAILESLLFVWGEELSFKKISSIMEIDIEEVKNIAVELAKSYQNTGLQLMILEDSVQISANVDYYDYIEKLGKESKSRGLSKSSIETLAIIAYKQPVTKTQIEKIRGVKSDKPLQTLLERNLIYEKGRLQSIGKPIIYATTNKFLKLFNLKSLAELPPINEFTDGNLLLKYEITNRDEE